VLLTAGPGGCTTVRSGKIIGPNGSWRYGRSPVTAPPGDGASRSTIRGMNVVFVEPFFPRNQREFARALAEAGAIVIGIGEYSADGFDDQLKGWLDHYEQVPSVTDA